MSYAAIKALHIISIISWMAGLLYIFRLYIYHIENSKSREICALLEVMERRLYRFICTPAMIASLLFGVWMLSVNQGLLHQAWFHGKVGALVFLFGYHGYCGSVRRKLMQGTCTLTSKQARMLNEVPTMCMIVIVFLAVLKPWT